MLLLVWVFSLMAPQSQDTVKLAEVEVYAPAIDRYAQGQKVITWDSEDLNPMQGKSLSDLLLEQTPVFVRQYGAGMLASPSFRGTSAGHTAVFWNGIPINSPSLGQSDLSILPVAAIDQVSLQFGSAGALFGNEAIGGSLHLASSSQFNKGLSLKLTQQVGSFGLYHTQFSVGYSTQKFSTKTRLYREFSENNFTYKDLGQFGTPTKKQDHAKVKQLGLVQDFGLNIDEKNQLKAAFWVNASDREIQPVMGSHTLDQQEDESVRAVLDYYHFAPNSTWNLKTGFVQDELLFNGSLSQTKQYFVAGDWDQDFSERINTKLGARYTLAKGALSTYTADDTRIEIYQSSTYHPSETLALSLNLRQLIYDSNFAPFTPNLGVDWRILGRNSRNLTLKSSIGKGFKVPTLNDRYWEPGGNLDLLPEESINGEIGLQWSNSGNFTWSHELTFYKMLVDNWIIWLPKGSFWTPSNIKKVNNQGLEYQGKASGEFGSWKWDITASYNYARAVTEKGIDKTDKSVGKQLPYTPAHQGNASIKLKKSGFSGVVSTYYVGNRSITADNPRMMPAYQLFNLGGSYDQIHLGRFQMPLSFQINNLFNTDYQVLYLRAMPGISYQFNLTILL